ncbi:hypothetical protein AJ79_08572 [Helicocarpus griseus UAMH5409]|uniref:WW domain-containing protein n=1 Tax=Helicocarpus griseus UAMH5409 TaxID=1447875 RepID=A0A2B7WRC5_9EURO|nr:hypothetical protein AJ79_08572 [Helicocarpus griseus UAMH5409]
MSRHGKDNDDEMFLTSPSDQTPPVVSPLRISKRNTPSPGPAAGQAAGHTTQPSAFSPAPCNPPLPYPDDRPRPQRMHSFSPSNSRPPYPDDGIPPSVKQSSKPSSPLYSGSGGSSPAEIPPSLRPRERRESKTAQSSLAERRGATGPKPLPESPVLQTPDKEGLFQKPPPRPAGGGAPMDYHQHWPAPGSSAPSSSNLVAPQQSTVNRIGSTASNSTTKAQRGSPPPPETPIVPPGPSDIESRYAAAGIAGTSTLSNLQAQSAAAQQRAQQYAVPQQNSRLAQPPNPAPRPWTPTETPGSHPHGPPTVYQGPVPASRPPLQSSGPLNHPPQGTTAGYPHNPLEEDFQRLNLTASPPPAYSSLGGPAPRSYPNEKQGVIAATHPAPMDAITTSAMAPSTMAPHSHTSPVSNTQNHPAFANDPRQADPRTSQPSIQNGHPGVQHVPLNGSPAPPGPSPASPPPLPEGWIAHLDPNSGQYYYIHLPTQSTQWEFPKGPTPLNLNEPMSPAASTFAGHPIASPGLSAFGPTPIASPAFSTFGQPLGSPNLPMTPGYEGSVMSMSTGFTGPPPISGVELYKVAPTNGVYFGPYLRYTNMDMERGLWLGSILLVTDAPQPPTIHIHQSVDLSPNPRQLKAAPISTHQRWTFYKYSIDLTMEEYPAKWTYAITSHLGCTRYEFLVAGRNETNWRFIATSGNDFSLSVNANERARLGGAGYMWKDIMQKHVDCGGFHVHLGLGSQINADRIWKEIPSLKQWLTISGKEQRKNAVWTAAHEEDTTHAYFHYYTSHFDQPHMREAFAQIPHVLQVDDHDIFDGFGSYPDYMQFSNMFKNIGRIGIEMYLLFQHHTTLEILRHVSDDMDLFTITGTGWHFVKYLGPAIAVVGPDCRSERNPHQVMAGPTYQGLFPKVAMLPPSVQHCIWMISVPPIYPRLESTEHFAQTIASGKKAVTGAYNVLGKVTSSVAGVVGAKGAVGSGFDSVKRAVGKSGLMGSVLNPFGDIEILDELRDQWTHDSKDLERTYLIRTLQGIAHQKSIRMTFLSGAVNCCGAGLVHDPSHPTDHKTMYQIISSSVVNTPPPSYVMKLLHGNNRPLYIPANGQRAVPGVATDTKEDMMEIFQTDVTGQPREHRRLMGRRNYVAIVGYDPDNVQTGYGPMSPTTPGFKPGILPKLSLAVDFLVQGDNAYGNVVKFGPVIVPSLELGR